MSTIRITGNWYHARDRLQSGKNHRYSTIVEFLQKWQNWNYKISPMTIGLWPCYLVHPLLNLDAKCCSWVRILVWIIVWTSAKIIEQRFKVTLPCRTVEKRTDFSLILGTFQKFNFWIESKKLFCCIKHVKAHQILKFCTILWTRFNITDLQSCQICFIS